MADPLSVTLITLASTEALKKGVEFLYGQANEILKRWRERKDKAAEAARKDETEVIEARLPEAAFEGQLTAPKIHFDKVERFEDELKALRNALAVYANGDEEVDKADKTLIERVDALRLLLEQIYQQRLTFKGEERTGSGAYIESDVEVGKVEGRVRGVVAEIGTNIRSKVKTGDVSQTGDVIGVDATQRKPGDEKQEG